MIETKIHPPETVPLSITAYQEERVVGEVPITVPGGGWRRSSEMTDEGRTIALVNARLRQTVLISAAVRADGKRWLHASIAGQSLPTYEDLCWLKRAIVGRHRKAILIFAPEEEHVNTHPNALHLFACLDEDPLPDFRVWIEELGRFEV